MPQRETESALTKLLENNGLGTGFTCLLFKLKINRPAEVNCIILHLENISGICKVQAACHSCCQKPASMMQLSALKKNLCRCPHGCMDAHVHIPKTNGNTPNIPNIEDDASKQGSTAVPSYERWISSVKTQKSNSFKKHKA